MADDPDRPTMPDRVTQMAGELLADLAPFGADREDLRAGLDALAPDATEEQVFEALDSGILQGLSWTEKRRALREYHEGAVEAGAIGPTREPLVDVARVEDEDEELVGLHVIASAPGASVYEGDDHVLIVAGNQASREVDVPFENFYVEHRDVEGVTEFDVRPVAVEPIEVPDDGDVGDLEEVIQEDEVTAEELAEELAEGAEESKFEFPADEEDDDEEVEE